MPTIRVVGDYEWKPPYSSSVPAPVFMAEFEKLAAESNAPVTARELVEHARPVTCVIHDIFEWDDQRAAEEYRVIQARQAMNHVAVRVVGGTVFREPIVIRAIINVREETNRGYISMIRALSDEDISHQMLLSSLREAQRFYERYRVLPAARPAVAMMRAYLESFEEESRALGIRLDDVEDAAESVPLMELPVPI